MADYEGKLINCLDIVPGAGEKLTDANKLIPIASPEQDVDNVQEEENSDEGRTENNNNVDSLKNRDKGEKAQEIPRFARKEVIEDKVMYRCLAGQKCKKTFFKLQTLEVHVESKHSKRRFQCDKCAKAFFTAREQKAHIKFVHIEPEQQCKTCMRKFKTSHMVTLHNEREHVQKKCMKCGFEGKGTKILNHLKNCQKKKFIVILSKVEGDLSWKVSEGENVEKGTTLGQVKQCLDVEWKVVR